MTILMLKLKWTKKFTLLQWKFKWYYKTITYKKCKWNKFMNRINLNRHMNMWLLIKHQTLNTYSINVKRYTINYNLEILIFYFREYLKPKKKTLLHIIIQIPIIIKPTKHNQFIKMLKSKITLIQPLTSPLIVLP